MKSLLTIMLGVLTLYSIALLCSMSAMEFLAWISVAVFGVALIQRKVKLSAVSIHPFVERSLLVFFIVGCIGLFLNGTGEEQLKGIGSMRWIVLLFVFSFWLEFPPLFRRSINVLIGFGAVTAIFALYQHFYGTDLNFILGLHKTSQVSPAPYLGSVVYQCFGFFGHHLKYGYSMLLIFALALAFGFQQFRLKAYSLAALYLVISSCMGLSLVWTYGRGVWAATFISVLVVAACFGRRVILTTLVASIMCVGVTLAISPGIRERAMSVGRTDYTSNSDRRDLWSANWAMFKDHPLFGVGILRNEDLTAEYYEKLGIHNPFVGHAHNTYINFLSMTGFPGAIAFLVFIGTFLFLSLEVIKSKLFNPFEHASAIGIFAGEIGFHVGGLTQCNFKDAVNNHLLIFLLAGIAALHRRKRSSLAATNI